MLTLAQVQVESQSCCCQNWLIHATLLQTLVFIQPTLQQMGSKNEQIWKDKSVLSNDFHSS